MRKDIKLGFADYLGKPQVQGYVAPLQDYVSGQPYVSFISRGWLKEYCYGNPYREFTVQGPNGPYIDCAYDGLYASIDEQVRTSIRLVKGDQTPVIQAAFNGVDVAGHRITNYVDKMVAEFIANTLLERGKQKHYFAFNDPARVPDELELMYPTAMKPLKIDGVYPDWVWDAVEALFPRYALANRPKPTVKRPYLNVGTIGHIDYPTLRVKPRQTKTSNLPSKDDWVFGMDKNVPFGCYGDF